MKTQREIDKRDSLRVVTSNSFITAKGLEKLSLKARKLLYVVTAQCKMNDEQFYEYSISPKEFADLMGIDKSNVYREAHKITSELAKSFIEIVADGKKNYRQYPLMASSVYEDEKLVIELNPRMTSFLLQLKRDFSKPLLNDFLKMNSPYSMAIWHLFQREMHSRKPGTRRIEFFVSVEELRKVTGTENKLKQIGQFKERVLDKALREIKDNCATDITYKNRKKGKSVIGFDFIAINEIGLDLTDWEKEFEKTEKGQRVKKKARRLEIIRKSKNEELTKSEIIELHELEEELAQMTLDDLV